MHHRIGRLALAIVTPLLLTGCLLTPGKFTSTLSINADRSFTFAYKGEVIAFDPSAEMGKALKDGAKEEPDAGNEDGGAEEDETLFTPIALQDEGKDAAETDADKERKHRAIAEALSKEAGYRSVQYLGEGKYLIDYQVSGALTHNFVYPYNIDAEVIFPFIAIELRKNGTVRLKAPAFGNESTGDQAPGRGEAAKLLDGTFTLDTDAEIVSQNNEDGVQIVKGRKAIVWKADPLSKAAPTAVLRMTR
ncbi:hypothetical protein [Sphingomonas cavernae]|uniref:Lipoprotein n=1 Tax=Sphingomonas cavernae TaxID=2320861 RepID=A0A418W852_9SPHN|nr:hypothetical protein [Sphingomonas cavernae]RJF86179.1 hypothetical protein D3876_17580 [Sphingomonas cavernae]